MTDKLGINNRLKMVAGNPEAKRDEQTLEEIRALKALKAAIWKWEKEQNDPTR